jgi:hypothetical protein
MRSNDPRNRNAHLEASPSGAETPELGQARIDSKPSLDAAEVIKRYLNKIDENEQNYQRDLRCLGDFVEKSGGDPQPIFRTGADLRPTLQRAARLLNALSDAPDEDRPHIAIIGKHDIDSAFRMAGVRLNIVLGDRILRGPQKMQKLWKSTELQDLIKQAMRHITPHDSLQTMPAGCKYTLISEQERNRIRQAYGSR